MVRDCQEELMRRTALYILAAVCALPAVVSAQKPTAATYITDEEVKKVNATPGVDRQIRVVDIGDENFAVGVVHRGPPVAAAAAPVGAAAGGAGGSRWRAAGGAGAGGAGGAAAGTVRRDGGTPPPAGTPTGLSRLADRGLLHHVRRVERW